MKTKYTEDILGDFGFRVVWEIENDCFADLKVYEIVARTIEEYNKPLFTRKGAHSLPDTVENIDDAETYMEGFIKRNSCAELDQGCPHWCSVLDWKKHIMLLENIYKRAFVLMSFDPEEEW